MKIEEGRSMGLVGIGVDIISLARVRSFLHKHPQNSLKKLLSESESKCLLGKKKISPVEFARFFTAKEAYFKAYGGRWMGLEGFSKIEIHPKARDRFTASSKAFRAKANAQVEGIFYQDQRFVVAEVLIWDQKN